MEIAQPQSLLTPSKGVDEAEGWMYVRRDTQELSGGGRQTYLSLAHNVWEPMGDSDKKRSRPVVFSRLGVEAELDKPTVKGMRDALDRYLRKRFGDDGDVSPASDPKRPEGQREIVEATAAELRPKLAPLKFLLTVDYGLRVIVEPVWKELGLEAMLTAFAGQHRIQFDFERVVFGMVLNRLVDPLSKLACNEWLKDRAYFPEGKSWNVTHFYRALDVLQLHTGDLDTLLFEALRKRLSPSDLELLLLDTTSTYFDSDLDDVERADVAADWSAHDKGQLAEAPLTPRPQVINDPPMRMRGHSKDHRSDLPQVVIATVCAKDGTILRHKTYPGNTADQTITLEMLVKAAEAEPNSKKVVVFDAGMGSERNLRVLDSLPEPPDRICAVPLRSTKFAREHVIGKVGRYRRHPTKAHMRVRVVQVLAEDSPSKRAEMWIATRNRKDAERVQRKLRKQERQVKEILAADDRVQDHSQKVADLLGHRALKRFVTTSEDGTRLVLDRAYLREERLLAGVHVLRTTLVDRDPIEVLNAYQALLEVEDNFRTFKGPLKLRPMHHRLAHRIEAHVTVCVLAMIVLRVLEKRTGLNYRQLVEIFAPVKATFTEQGDTRFWQRNEWDAEAERVLAALGIDAGARAWGATRVEQDDT